MSFGPALLNFLGKGQLGATKFVYGRSICILGLCGRNMIFLLHLFHYFFLLLYELIVIIILIFIPYDY